MVPCMKSREEDMHLIVRSHLNDFSRIYPSTLDESERFEAFLNYCVLRQFSADNVDPADLVFLGQDPGIDGAMIIIGDAYVSTEEELVATLDAQSRDVDVSILFTEAKRSESWNKSEINSFSMGIADFLSEDPSFPMSNKLAEVRNLFFKLFEYIGKIRGGKPSLFAYFATTSKGSTPLEIQAAFDALKRQLIKIGYFGEVQVIPTDRDKIVSLWRAAGGSTAAQIETIGIAAFPKAPGIDASYVATVSAQKFIDNIITDEGGKLRQRIFDENVRDYIGADNEVNQEIASTIVDHEKQRRFGVMNNGVTIVSPDVRVQGNEIFLRDFQIINGCQTSNVLYENRASVGPDANLMIKIVHAREPTFLEDIVRSTNRQSKVQDAQFLATIEAVKGVEKYFEARTAEEDQRLFFERRKNQYAGRGLPAIRIFDVKHLARCVGAMFVERPDLATRYPNRLTGELKKDVYNPEFDEEIFYTSAHAYYRVYLHFSNQRLDQRFSNLKWHLLMGIQIYLDQGESKNLKNRKIRELCKRIQSLVSSNEQKDIGTLASICEAISNGAQLNRDQLRNQSLLQSMRSSVQSLKKD